MITHHPVHPPSHLATRVAAEPRHAFPARRELPRRAAIAGGIALGSLTLSLLLSSCGRSGSDGTPAEVRAEAMPAPVETVVASVQQDPIAPSADTSDAGGLPPDLSVTAMDTELAPGESVQLVAQATPDVVEMTLWDGLHDKQSLAYDVEAKVWHGAYRVPLSTRTDRIGLAVTARNDAQRWRRVWVFLTVRRDEPKAELESEQGSNL